MDDLQYLALFRGVSAFIYGVLNLVINGWPSIPFIIHITAMINPVLNLVINGWPSIQKGLVISQQTIIKVLNLVINGWPSIQVLSYYDSLHIRNSFKPCYKWMTFNTGW